MASKSHGWDVRIIAKISPKMAKKSRFSIFFDFLKDCPSTPYYGPLCVIASNSYGWDVRNIAKINPKMAKTQPFFNFFFDFRKNSS